MSASQTSAELVPQEHAHVGIVGAGPTGLLLAAELVRRGVRVSVWERTAALDQAPRANGLVGAIGPMLRRRGVLAGSGLRIFRPPRFPFGPVTLRIGLAGPLHVVPVPQRRLAALLERRAVGGGANILRSTEVVGFEESAGRVRVRLRREGGEREQEVDYLVGCDGAHSMVRKGIGVGFPGTTSDSIARLGRIILPSEVVHRTGGEIEIDGLGRLRLFEQNRSERGWVTLAPATELDSSARPDEYVVSTHEPRGEAEPSDPLDPAELRASISRVLGGPLPFTHASALRSTVANSRQAEHYRVGRVLLAGDAAHVFAAGGSALNVGLTDALALADALGDALVDGSPSRLDGYDAQRHAAGRRALLLTRLQADLAAHDERAEALRQVFEPLASRRPSARALARLVESP